MSGAFAHRSVRLVAAVLAGLKLWLVSAQPVLAIGASPHDDRLFLRLANTFLDGTWLGAYSHFTLIKGPAYPLFIGGTVAAGIPLPLAQQLLYLVACWLLLRALRPCLPNDGWALGIFFVLLWQPMTWQIPNLGRVLRQNLYTPCTLLVFAGLTALYTRANARTWVRAGWAALLGLAWGTLWLTREESIWIVPATLVLVTAAILAARRQRRTWWGSTQAVLIATVAAATPIVFVCAMNARHYGWWGTVEFRAPEFISAYGALTRVQVGPALARVPVTREAREAIYQVSPAFAELRPWLEGELSESYARHSASASGLDPAQREMAGGWFMWALRDAVFASGDAPDAATALAFYQKLADEVNAACDRGELPAGRSRATLLPTWRSEYTAAMWHELPRALIYLATFADFNARAPSSVGDAQTLRLFRDLTQWFISPAADAPELDTPTATEARSYRVAALQVLGHGLRWLYAALIGFGTVAWLAIVVRAMRRREWPSYRWWCASVCAGTVLAVVLINVLVHVTSFPNISPAAFAQAYALALLFALLSLLDLAEGIRPQPDALPPIT